MADLRLHLPAALLRRFARACGGRDRQRETLVRLITLYVDGAIDPWAEGDPVMAARGAKGGAARAASLDPETRSAQAKAAAVARWAR
jgi:hypothetical protein